MTRRQACLLGAIALAFPLSQLGHQVAYLVHYGTAGLAYQSRSVHAYFPDALKASGAVLGLLALAVLVVLGAARAVRGRAGRTPMRREVGWVEALAFLLCIQLQLFLTQEVLELVAAGHHVGLLDLPLAWGLVGQLPVALLAALAISWLSGRLVAAVRGLRHAWSGRRRREAPSILVQVWVEPARAALLSATAPETLGKRGPPVPSR